MIRTYKFRRVYGTGVVRGRAVVCRRPISFLGDVDGSTGTVRVDGERLPLKDRVLIVPYSIGSTVGPYVLYQLRKRNLGPSAIACTRADNMLIIASVICDIPIVTDLPDEVLNLPQGAHVVLDLNEEVLTVLLDAGEDA